MAVGALVLVSQAIPAAAIVGAGDLTAVVTGQFVPPSGGAIGQFLGSGLPVLAVVPFWVAWIIRQVASFRHAEGDVREQYKWFTAGAAVSLVGIVVLTLAESNGGSGLASVVNAVALYATGVAFPLGMGVAILRYRLYEIDRIISRTLAYAIVTGLLIGVYAGLVLLATRVLTVHAPVAVAAATLAAAALFTPLRRRVQRSWTAGSTGPATTPTDRCRLRHPPAGRRRPGHGQTDLTGVVHGALEPAHVSLWIAGGPGDRPHADPPRPAARAGHLGGAAWRRGRAVHRGHDPAVHPGQRERRRAIALVIGVPAAAVGAWSPGACRATRSAGSCLRSAPASSWPTTARTTHCWPTGSGTAFRSGWWPWG